MKKRILASILIIIGVAMLGILPEAEPDADKKAVLMIVDYVSLDDFLECSFISSMMKQGYLALMNNRQPGKPNQYASKLILGSAKRLDIGTDMIKNGNIYAGRHEYHIKKENGTEDKNVLYTDIIKLKNNTTSSGYNTFIGYLGENVIKNNGSTCILGNADTDKPNRSSIFTVMDSRGIVSCGEVDDILMKDDFFPYGIRTDYKRLAELYKQFLPASSFVVIDTGDMERLESYRTNMGDQAYGSCKTEVLKKIDGFAEEIFNNGGVGTFILISTFPSEKNYRSKERLTPVIVFDGQGKGVLHSKSTRREGIILNTDIADYILHKLGYENRNNVVEIEKESSWVTLKEMNKEVVAVSRLRVPVLYNYAAFVIISLVILLLVLIYTAGKKSSLMEKIIRITAYTNLSIPLVLLYMPIFKIFNVYMFIILAFFQSVLISILVESIAKSELKKIMILNLLLFFGLCLDILLGGHMLKQSVLGYDAIIGARFYGIGNEYAGVFIGCSILLLGCVMELKAVNIRKLYIAVYSCICTTFLGLAILGANFGGAMAGLVGYTLAYYLIYDIKFSWRHMANAIVFIGAIIALLIAIDFSGLCSTSHIGSFAGDISENGVKVILSTIQRKLQMNLRLIRYTIWTKVLFFTILTIAFLFYKPVKPLRSIFERYKYLNRSWIAVSAASITGFFTNDSGIVMAATAMIYVVFTMLPLCADSIDNTWGNG